MDGDCIFMRMGRSMKDSFKMISSMDMGDIGRRNDSIIDQCDLFVISLVFKGS